MKNFIKKWKIFKFFIKHVKNWRFLTLPGGSNPPPPQKRPPSPEGPPGGPGTDFSRPRFNGSNPGWNFREVPGRVSDPPWGVKNTPPGGVNIDLRILFRKLGVLLTEGVKRRKWQHFVHTKIVVLKPILGEIACVHKNAQICHFWHKMCQKSAFFASLIYNFFGVFWPLFGHFDPFWVKRPKGGQTPQKLRKGHANPQIWWNGNVSDESIFFLIKF